MKAFDRFGPEKILQVFNPKIGLNGFVVIDNTALGPGKGGIRMTSTVSVEEVFKLARTMTWKNSLAGLPFGGAKAGIVANPKKISLKCKYQLVKAFSKAIKPICPSEYVAAPDMNMAEKEMFVFAKANGSLKSCTGKPLSMGGLPHELGSTGYGVFHATDVAVKFVGKKVSNVNVAIEGFGNVGWFAAKFLHETGSNIVAVSDSKGLIFNARGIDFEKLALVKEKKGSVIRYSPGKVLPNHKIISLDVDVLITAAIPDLIKQNEINKVKAKVIVEGSNIPMSHKVEELLAKKDVLIVPDFVANAGGVISSYVEYINGSKEKMFKMVKQRIRKNTKAVLKKSVKSKCPRCIALKIAEERVVKKCKTCGKRGEFFG